MSMTIDSGCELMEVMHPTALHRHGHRKRPLAFIQRAEPGSRATTTAPPPVQALYRGRMAFLGAVVAGRWARCRSDAAAARAEAEGQRQLEIAGSTRRARRCSGGRPLRATHGQPAPHTAVRRPVAASVVV